MWIIAGIEDPVAFEKILTLSEAKAPEPKPHGGGRAESRRSANGSTNPDRSTTTLMAATSAVWLRWQLA